MNQNNIKLHENLMNFMFHTMKLSKANKRKVAALLFDDSNSERIINSGFNYNIVNDVCENNNNETFDTVIHAEQSCIFNYFREHNQVNTGKLYNMLVSYSPCIECAKQIVLSGIIKAVYIYEEHEVNFRQAQYVSGSLSPLDLLLNNGIDVYIFNEQSNCFEKIDNQKIVCVYHSEDLDGFMSKYLFDNYYDSKNTKRETFGYNYQTNASWMNENFKQICFIDVTPTIEWFKNNLNKNILIFDHHTDKINQLLEIIPEHNIIESHKTYRVFAYKNIRIYQNNTDDVSGCAIFNKFLELSGIKINPYIEKYINYISIYDTWSFINLENSAKEKLLNIIETLKLLNIDEFANLFDNIHNYNYKQTEEKLNYSGKYIRIKNKNTAATLLDKAILHVSNNIQLIVGNIRPNYDIEIFIRENFKIPVIYVYYSINLQDKNVKFSVRHYPINNVESSINALKIAKHFNGGGHPDTSGFTVSINEFTEMLKDDFQEIKNLI